MGKENLLNEIRELVRRVTKFRFEGGSHVEKARVQAYADGYMRALMDAELVDRKQLLQLIGEERQNTLRAA
ncbi:MAG: hypothetical protein JXA30_17705 [Deltaproteobacteria bacterium]|nr:hypothetical protein [Deltaproteobacteria bacterium]